ncbi:hypothetical protein EH31_03945 [Erythrobacter longus]|uniref:Uncharacterized protein n=1 Tax=Erythrobacter longus TaxID=1044 RepID=A0A074MG95_ERYLO|nr:hypothetical protein EH31_03945 [Erythrobacter longus]
MDPSGLEAYYISRPVYFDGFFLDHAFVAVKEPGKDPVIFSFDWGEDGALRPSDPNVKDGTYKNDEAYFKKFLEDPTSVPGNRINASDETVLAVGNAYNEALTINDIDYVPYPWTQSNSCNSNCAAGIIADESVQAEGGRGHPAPANAQAAPGRASRSRLDPLVRTPAERRASERFNNASQNRKFYATRLKN